jgi:hypothetical protein
MTNSTDRIVVTLTPDQVRNLASETYTAPANWREQMDAKTQRGLELAAHIAHVGEPWQASNQARISAECARDLLAALLDAATEQHVAYPQYAGHWDGAEWYLARMSKAVKTGLGTAFVPGEWVLARDYTPEEQSRYVADYTFLHGKAPKTNVMAYSVRNAVDTSVPASALQKARIL